MKKRAIIVIILSIFITIQFGCNRYRTPPEFPNPDEMAEIIVDLQILESTLSHATEIRRSHNDNIENLYKDILYKHNLTAKEFDTIRRWYVNHPEIYQRVYEKAITKLSEREAEARIAIQREEEEAEKARLEAIEEVLANLWQDSTSIDISPGDTTDKKVPFHIEVDTLNLQEAVTLSATYRFLKEDISSLPQMMLSANYNDSVADTIYTKVPHSFRKNPVSLTLNLKEDTFPQYLSGYLLLQDSIEDVSVEIRDIKLEADSDSLHIKMVTRE
ncbi:DUF4296 domain-containing protein [Marinilabiliaceae bacterium ANBcel2]|nr:DUF4296 domain-containing protein [Marinilabiliaceae bacterium ANBcel2]